MSIYEWVMSSHVCIWVMSACGWVMSARTRDTGESEHTCIHQLSFFYTRIFYCTHTLYYTHTPWVRAHSRTLSGAHESEHTCAFTNSILWISRTLARTLSSKYDKLCISAIAPQLEVQLSHVFGYRQVWIKISSWYSDDKIRECEWVMYLDSNSSVSCIWV